MEREIDHARTGIQSQEYAASRKRDPWFWTNEGRFDRFADLPPELRLRIWELAGGIDCGYFNRSLAVSEYCENTPDWWVPGSPKTKRLFIAADGPVIYMAQASHSTLDYLYNFPELLRTSKESRSTILKLWRNTVRADNTAYELREDQLLHARTQAAVIQLIDEMLARIGFCTAPQPAVQ